jgi:hypothetical protein
MSIARSSTGVVQLRAMKKTALSLLAACLFSSGSALADTKTHPGAQIQFWLPDGWNVEKTNANAMTAADPSGDLGLVFVVTDAGNLQAAAAGIDQVMAGMVQGLEVVGKPVETKINGMPAIAIDAKGAVAGDDGLPVDVLIGAVVVIGPAKKPLVVLGFVDAGKYKRNEPTLKKIFGSMKPMSGGF